MKKLLFALMGCALTAVSLSPVAVQAAGFPTILGASQASEARLEQVHRRYYRHHRHRSNAGAAIAAGIIGLGVGAAIASQPRYYYEDGPVYDRDPDYDAYCFSKYRSYDPRSGTYLGYDGYRHPCR